MRLGCLVPIAFVLGGCAANAVKAPSEGLLRDHLFAPPSQPIRADEVFAVSEEMKRYLVTDIAPQFESKGKPRGLYEALYSRDLLRIEYDAAITRNAAETFAARSGNCLSLAIMTAALAKHLGLHVGYQAVSAEELWSRMGGIYFSSRHVNVTLGRRHTDPRHRFHEERLLTIDFMPVGQLQKQYAWTIPERTVVAMYMNNRAAEVLAEGRIDDAYWFAREATTQDPGFMTAFNTLGVVYRRHGHLREAQAVLEHVIAHEPSNTHALSNLAVVYADQGRHAEAQAMSRRLAVIQPDAPFQAFERGLAAMKRADYAAARDFFAREAQRDPTYHEFQFWLAAAYAGLGDYTLARKHLKAAIASSPAGDEKKLYAAKLSRLSSKQP